METPNSTQRVEPEVIYVNPPEKRPVWGAFSDLYFNPLRFFSDTVALGYKPLLPFVVWVVGMSDVIDRIDSELLKQDVSQRRSLTEVYGTLTGSWLWYWGAVALLGILGGLAAYYIGSWWYNKRLHMCGSTEHKKGSADLVYIYTSFIFCLPIVLYTLMQTFFYPDYATAYNADDMLSFVGILLLIFPFWAVVNSYRTVAEFFAVDRKKAKLWFLILPIAIYVIAFGVFATILAVMGMSNEV